MISQLVKIQTDWKKTNRNLDQCVNRAREGKKTVQINAIHQLILIHDIAQYHRSTFQQVGKNLFFY